MTGVSARGSEWSGRIRDLGMCVRVEGRRTGVEKAVLGAPCLAEGRRSLARRRSSGRRSPRRQDHPSDRSSPPPCGRSAKPARNRRGCGLRQRHLVAPVQRARGPGRSHRRTPRRRPGCRTVARANRARSSAHPRERESTRQRQAEERRRQQLVGARSTPRTGTYAEPLPLMAGAELTSLFRSLRPHGSAYPRSQPTHWAPPSKLVTQHCQKSVTDARRDSNADCKSPVLLITPSIERMTGAAFPRIGHHAGNATERLGSSVGRPIGPQAAFVSATRLPSPFSAVWDPPLEPSTRRPGRVRRPSRGSRRSRPAAGHDVNPMASEFSSICPSRQKLAVATTNLR